MASVEELPFQFYLSSDPLLGDFYANGMVNDFDWNAWRAGCGIAYTGD